jgi:hypothetical protein
MWWESHDMILRLCAKCLPHARLAAAAIICGCNLLLSGCSDNRPPGIDLQGTVTWQGRPVPSGFVVFSPDPTKGGSGHQGMAPIQDGRYDTRFKGGRRVAFGPQIVNISGFDPPDVASGRKRGVRLFLPTDVPVEVSQNSSELNLVVPDRVPRLKGVPSEDG